MSANADLLARRNAALPRGLAVATPVYADRAENAELWDVEGKRYIDFAGGIAVLNTGHRHPKVMAAVKAQLERFTHTAFQVMAYEPYIALAERLNALAPFKGPAKTMFLTTGAEAVENAVKIARAATKRSGGHRLHRRLPRPHPADHGADRQGGALQEGLRPDAGRSVPRAVPDCALRRDGRGFAEGASQRLFKADVDPARVAAIIIEPVQGEGGFHVAPFELLRALRKLCDEHGILLIADEVQTGFARTGKMFGIEHSGVEPDMITMAKSLAGGFPLSGVVGRAEVMDAPGPGGLGGTYGGNPVACAAALAVLDVIAGRKSDGAAHAMGERVIANGCARWRGGTICCPSPPSAISAP